MSRAPTYFGNAIINPNFYDTALGQAELAAERRIELQRSLRDIGSEIERQGQLVQSGSQIITPEERAQRQEMLRDAASTLQSLGPLAAAGAVSGDEVRRAVGQTAAASLNEQRTRQKAARDMQAIVRLSDNGTHNEAQTTSAMDSLKREYGESTLLSVPGYATYAGLGDQLAESRREQIGQYAEAHGIDPNVLRWDERENAPVLDEKVIAVEQYKTFKEQSAVAKLDKVWTNQRKDLETASAAVGNQIRVVASALNTAHKQGQDIAPLTSQLRSLMNEQFKINARLRGEVEQRVEELENDAPVALDKRSSHTTFTTGEDAVAAARGGQIKPGSTVLIGGVPARFVDGKFKRVVGE